MVSRGPRCQQCAGVVVPWVNAIPGMPVCQSEICQQCSRVGTLRAGCMLLLAGRPAVSLAPAHAWKWPKPSTAQCFLHALFVALGSACQ